MAATAAPVAAAAQQPGAPLAAAQRPSAPPDVPQYFAPVRTMGPASSHLAYEPRLFGAARLHFTDAKLGLNEVRDFAAFTPLRDGPDAADWRQGEATALAVGDLESGPARQPHVEYAALPAEAARARSYAAWSKRFAAWVHADQQLTLYRSPSLGVTSRPGESEALFRNRLALAGREERDRQIQAIRERYGPRFARLQEQIRKAEQALEREKQQVSSQTMQSALSIGAGLLGAVFGRKILSATNVSKVGTAARSVSRIGKERSDVGRAEENLEALQAKVRELETELDAAVEARHGAIDPLSETLDEVSIRLKKTAIDVRLLALVWLPYWREANGAEPRLGVTGGARIRSQIDCSLW